MIFICTVTTLGTKSVSSPPLKELEDHHFRWNLPFSPPQDELDVTVDFAARVRLRVAPRMAAHCSWSFMWDDKGASFGNSFSEGLFVVRYYFLSL